MTSILWQPDSPYSARSKSLISLFCVNTIPCFKAICQGKRLRSTHNSEVQGTESPAGVRGVPALTLSPQRDAGPPN